MTYFENDPLAQVHLDLVKGKTLTHFDSVLTLKGLVKEDFTVAAEKFYYRKFNTSKNTAPISKPKVS